MISVKFTHLLFAVGFFSTGLAQNPLINDQFTADPSARVFNGKIYVYPSHDIEPPEGEGRPDWFNMADYHVFSSENLTNWEDHGVILDQNDVPWADSKAYSMWAPDAIEKDGKYYFYFPTRRKESSEGEEGFSIGVAIADNPQGPFKAEAKPIEGVSGIDPNIFIDNDGQAYIYWSRDKIYGAKLHENMLELTSEPKVFEVPKKGHIEGPWIFEREGNYYLTYPHVANNTERLEYAIGNNPLGPFNHMGVIMDESPNGVWTNHHSILNYKDQWYLFYHHADYSPNFDKLRSIRADSLQFNKDGSIQKVIPSLRGIGVLDANDTLQIDRYSAKSDSVSIKFNHPENTFEGWHAILEEENSWLRFNTVHFEDKLNVFKAKINSEEDAILEIRLGGKTGKLLAEIKTKPSKGWKIISADLSEDASGIQDIVILSKKGNVKIDWIKFEG